MGTTSEDVQFATREMRRVLVVGTTCAGKTTLSRSLSNLLNLPHVEFDSLFWDPNWTYVPDGETRRRLEKSTAGTRWILDGNFQWLQDIVWERADTLIWLDYPMPVALWRALKRTVRRCMTRECLWGSNVESWWRTFFSSDSVPLWAIKSWRQRRRDYAKMVISPASKHMHIFRLRTPTEADEWLHQLAHAGHAEEHLPPLWNPSSSRASRDLSQLDPFFTQPLDSILQDGDGERDQEAKGSAPQVSSAMVHNK